MVNLIKDTLYLSTNGAMYKRLYWVGIAGYLIMLILSILFYKERILLLDNSFLLFHIVRENTFCIAHYRFGDIFNQALPVLATKSGQALSSVALCYSLGYVVYYFLCYFISGSILKRYDFALTILFLNLLFVSDTFYWTPSELPQGIALLLVTLAFASNKQLTMTKPALWVLLAVPVITIAFFHPVIIFVLLYSCFFFLERNDQIINKQILYIVAGIFFLAIILKAFVFRTPYEQHSAGGLKHFITLFPDYFTLYSNKQFLVNCIVKYYWIPLIFVSVLVFYYKRKAWKNFAFFLCCFFGYLLLINVSYPNIRTTTFYIENLYLPLSIFLALPFIFDLLPLLETKRLSMPIILLITLSGCARIYFMHNPYTARLEYERYLINKYGDTKVIVKAQPADLDALKILWATPYEMLLLSECERHKPASIIIDENPDRLGWATYAKDELLVNWNVYKYQQLPAKYFNFRDTVTGYAIITQPTP